ncbi:unnamed protein product [Ilex paraguariensis]|uniref:Glycosyltransferase n=1 Tax=Ilex paraguariensis TaxID=185542 RepID=A0ABC8RBD0_9AQUA
MSVTGGHVAVFAFPFGTHAAPLLTLVQRLAAAAPNLRFSFFCSTQSNQKAFSRVKHEGFDNIKPYNVADGVPEGHVFSGHPLEAMEFFLNAMPKNFKSRLEDVVEETGLKVSCLLTDAFLWFSGDMAEEMGVPWVAFWTAGPCSISIHIYTDVIRNTIQSTAGKAENADQTLNFLPGMAPIHVNDLPEGVLYGNLDSPFSRMLHNMGLTVEQATTVEEIDPVITDDLKSKMKKVLNHHHPSYSDENGCISWLDKCETASVAYLSFGTILTPPPPELLSLAEALEEKGVPFIWSFRDNSKQHVLEGFLERTRNLGKVVPWAPQLQVLQHPSVGVFITHCGWNSVWESIAGGVPMICRPFFGDQKLNRRMVEDVWKIGVGVEGGIFTKCGTVTALDLVLLNEKGKKMRENTGGIKANAVKAVGTNGSSTENFETLLEVVTTSKKT